MKQLVFCMAALSLTPVVFAQDAEYYYWYRGEIQPLQINENKHFVLFEYDPELTTLAREIGTEPGRIEEIRRVPLSATRIPHAGRKIEDGYWTVITADPAHIDLDSPLVRYHAPFFYSALGTAVGLSHLFYVRLHQADDIAKLEALARIHGVEILGNNSFMPLWYTLACDRNSSGNALEMANLFYESGLFRAAQPDLMADLLHAVNDSFFGDQWNLNNTGQYGGTAGSDIQVLNAWEISRSHSGIVLAVLDHGLEMNHPDLPNIHALSFDTESGTSPSKVYGDHGVAVAGIAGAATGNNEGVAGIAPDGELMSISNSLFLYPNVSQDLADGINFAWQNGAHIINNSWGSDALQQEIIDAAIDDAVTWGREGLGTVLVFSTGNTDTPLSYPSTNSKVIAVGAVSMCDERTSPSSCDTEQWGSNYGTGLAVVAPGVLIPTTDRQPPNGYNPDIPIHPWSGGTLLIEDDEYDDQNYTIWFNGTSAAAPHVAGIASLILGINESLTVDEVRYVLEATAEKVGNYSYTLGAGERPDLTWNAQMGYGRVNAYQALRFTLENHGGTVGIEKPQVTLPLWEDMNFHADVCLASGSTLRIEAHNTVKLTAASGSVTIGCAATGTSGSFIASEPSDNTKLAIASHDDAPERPPSYRLSQNYPNPFNPSTHIPFTLPESAHVTLTVYDLLGQEVAVLVSGHLPAGEHTATFNASGVATGVYLYRFAAGGFTETRRMAVVR